MANLTIRRLDDQTYERLKVRAARDGVSMEEEARRILASAVAPPGRLGDLFVKTFGAARGLDLSLPARRPHEPPDLE
jgi:plasmid stability protein